MKPVKNQGIVIDGSMHQNEAYVQKHSSHPSTETFPKKTSQSKSNVQSFSTVIEQAVLTQDRPLLKEILIQSEIQSIAVTVSELSSSKISGLLSLLEEFIYADSKNTRQLGLWVKEIIFKHLGVLISNHQNKETISRLRKFIGKRTAERENLITLSSRLKIGGEETVRKQFVTRFHYVEDKEHQGMGEDLMMEEMMDDEDEILAELDD